MIRTTRLPEFPSVDIVQKNSVVEQLIKIIDVHEHNAQIYKDEIEKLKAQIAGLQKASPLDGIIKQSPTVCSRKISSSLIYSVIMMGNL